MITDLYGFFPTSGSVRKILCLQIFKLKKIRSVIFFSLRSVRIFLLTDLLVFFPTSGSVRKNILLTDL